MNEYFYKLGGIIIQSQCRADYVLRTSTGEISEVSFKEGTVYFIYNTESPKMVQLERKAKGQNNEKDK